MIRKVDGNQAEIIANLRTIPGMTVTDTHMVGHGYPDFCCGWRGVNWLFECKYPGQARRLTKDERAWLNAWQGQAAVIESFEDACRIMGVT